MGDRSFLPKVDIEAITSDIRIVQPASGVSATWHLDRRWMIVVARIEAIWATRMEPAAGGRRRKIGRFARHRLRSLGFVKSGQAGQ
jgi:hypothetical protein